MCSGSAAITGRIVRFFSRTRNALFTRMVLAVRRLQVGDGQVQVTLGGGQRTVAEDFLNVAQVGLIFHQVCRAGVPPQVASDVFFDVRPFRIFFHQRTQRIK